MTDERHRLQYQRRRVAARGRALKDASAILLLVLLMIAIGSAVFFCGIGLLARLWP